MRLLFLATDGYGMSGGIALYNRDLAAALAAMEDVEALTVVARHGRPAGESLPDKVRVVVGAASGKAAWLVAVMREALRPVDVVVCGHINLLAVAATVAALRRARLVLIVHGVDVWQPHRSALIRRLVQRAAAVWAVSTLTRDRLRAWSGLGIERFSIMPGAVRPECFGPRAGPDDRRFGTSGRTALLTLARLSSSERYKGVDEMLDVMPRLVQRHPSLLYLIAGDGDDRLRLEAKAAALGVASHVRFLGFVDEADKADLYRAADAFVMPGRGEGLGLVYLEALACGTPVVGSAVDGSREALRYGALGELVDPDRPEEIIAAVERALAKPRGVPDGLAHFAWPSFSARAALALRALAPAKRVSA